MQANHDIVFGGEFTSVSGVARNRIARVNSGGVLDTAFNPSLNGALRDMV